MSKIKFIFDLDSTITSEETLSLVAKHFNAQEEIDLLTHETIQGDIPFVESFIRSVFILGKLPVDEVALLLESVNMYSELVNFIRLHKDQCVVATSNLDCWTNKLLAKFGSEAFCSEATVENNNVVKILKILRMEQIVEKFQNMGYTVVFVGGGNNDIEAMRIADISIATGITHYPSKSILPFANYLIFSDEALCRQLNQLL